MYEPTVFNTVNKILIASYTVRALSWFCVILPRSVGATYSPVRGYGVLFVVKHRIRCLQERYSK